MECGHLGAFDHTVPAARGHQVGPIVQACYNHVNSVAIVHCHRGKYGYSVIK